MEKNTKVILIFFAVVIVLVGFMAYITIPENVNEVQVVGKGINSPKGNPDSKVIIVEFSDFQCPACKAALPVIEEILKENDAVFYYRNFPLLIHKNSVIAAEAAECANEQGKFWEYHDVLFENQDRLDEKNLKKYAFEVGLDSEKFNDCFDFGKYKNVVQVDLKEGKSLGVGGTPTFFVNGKMVLGADKDKIEKIITEELEE